MIITKKKVEKVEVMEGLEDELNVNFVVSLVIQWPLVSITLIDIFNYLDV